MKIFLTTIKYKIKFAIKDFFFRARLNLISDLFSKMSLALAIGIAFGKGEQYVFMFASASLAMLVISIILIKNDDKENK